MKGRAFWNGVLFALIGGITSALTWPDGKPLDWRFCCGVTLGAAVAIKAFIAKSGEPNSDPPAPTTKEAQ